MPIEGLLKCAIVRCRALRLVGDVTRSTIPHIDFISADLLSSVSGRRLNLIASLKSTLTGVIRGLFAIGSVAITGPASSTPASVGR